MAKRKQRSGAKPAKDESPETLARLAAAHLEGGRFKEAAADYKRLLKEDAQQPQWVCGLAQAYAGRARHLAQQGMIKEAIALWQTRAESCGEPLADPRYLSWLLAAGRMQELVRLYRQSPQALAGEDGIGRLQARLAAGALANGESAGRGRRRLLRSLVPCGCAGFPPAMAAAYMRCRRRARKADAAPTRRGCCAAEH